MSGVGGAVTGGPKETLRADGGVRRGFTGVDAVLVVDVTVVVVIVTVAVVTDVGVYDGCFLWVSEMFVKLGIGLTIVWVNVVGVLPW
jgi:hypothetical protein